MTRAQEDAPMALAVRAAARCRAPLGGVVLAVALAACAGDAAGRTGEVVTLPAARAPIVVDDTAIMAAQAELAGGSAWHATRRLLPIARSDQRTPEAMLVLARAMADWGGWEEVRRALEPEPWVATRFDGEALALLARAALERGDAEDARRRAEDALRLARDPAARAVRLVLLARALDRLAERDSAAAVYRRAGDALPSVRDWLRLREAGVTRDADARARIYARVRLPAARARVPYTEAQALELQRLHVAAANAYEALGDQPAAFRLRLTSGDPALRAGVRAGLLGYLQRDATGPDLQRGLEVLDAAFPALDETTELLVARLAAAGGLHARAADGFARVSRLVTDDDVALWSRALISAGRPAEAARLIGERRLGQGPAAVEVRFQRGRALLRAGSAAQARVALQRVITRHAAAPRAADARYLLADIENDAGNDDRARALLELACAHAAPGAWSDNACFRAGLLTLVLGNAGRAAALFDQVPARFPRSADIVAARYWAGRAYARAGDSARAAARFRTVLGGDPLSYYAGRAAARLDTVTELPSPAPVEAAPEFAAAMERAAALRHLGMTVEEGFELDQIERDATANPALALGAGAAMLQRDDVLRAIRLGWRHLAAAREAMTARDATGRPDQRGYRLAFPLLRREHLVDRARVNGIDPALVAAVIRQESAWHPRAESRAGALGLMQVLPSVGAEIANARRFPAWDPALLFVPEINLELGTAHLASAVKRYPDLPRALAAYNAGGTRVRRWNGRAGTDDPEMFIERIPFAETRDYVRVVLRNVELYRALYGLK